MRAQLPQSLPKVLQPEVPGVGSGKVASVTAAVVRQVFWPQLVWGPSPPTQAQDMCSLLATEPSVEEKLQKLHSEIKFALKVDNPVRPS